MLVDRFDSGDELPKLINPLGYVISKSWIIVYGVYPLFL